MNGYPNGIPRHLHSDGLPRVDAKAVAVKLMLGTQPFYLNCGSRECLSLMNCSSWCGLPCFRVIYFPADIFFKDSSKSAAAARMLYICDNVIHLMCHDGKMLRITTIGLRLRYVYFVVYKCMSFCSQNRIGNDQ